MLLKNRELPAPMAFPEVKLSSGENINAALTRIVTEFQSEGFKPEPLTPLNEGQDVLRTLMVTLPDCHHAFMICTDDWTEQRENLVVRIASAIGEGVGAEPLEFHLCSLTPLSAFLRYYLRDATRLRYIMQAGKIVKLGQAVSAETAPAIAISMIGLWSKFFAGRFSKKENPIEHVDEFILNVLRDQKDIEGKEDIPPPVSAIIGLGCYAGQLMKELLAKKHPFDVVWVNSDSSDGPPHLDVGMIEKRSFFRNGRRHLLFVNPIGKAFKRFDNGAGDSLVGLYSASIAMANDILKNPASHPNGAILG